MNKLHKALATPHYKAKGYYPFSFDGIDFKCDPYHINFWRSIRKKRWEMETFEVLRNNLTAESTYVDIGAWIGPTVLYAAKRCKKVICFEPDPTAFKFLRWNLELNDIHNAMAFNIALSTETGMHRMGSFGKELGDSMTSLLNDDHADGVDVMTQTFDDFQKYVPLPHIDLIKIDIEGGEFDLLPTLRPYLEEHQPTVYLSTHAPWMPAGEREEKMQQIAAIMNMYDECYDDYLQKVDFSSQCAGEPLNSFHAYLFKKS